MQVLPVMDLMRGEVVRGVAGQRESYRPIQSQLSQASTPPAVAEAFHRSLGLSEVYLADLDAIGGGEPDWDIYRAVAGCGVKLWVDAGLVDAGQAFALLEFDPHGAVISGVVAGLETASGPKAVEEMLRAVGKGRLVFSLDMQAGRPLASSSQWGSDPVAIAEQVIAMGV